MFNISKIKNISLMLAFSAIFAAATFAQSASAIAILPYSDILRPVQNYTIEIPNLGTYDDVLDVTRLKNLRGNDRDSLISYMQFDINYPSNVNIESAYLSLIGSGSGKISIYQVSDDWASHVSSQTDITNLRNSSSPLLFDTMISADADNQYFNKVNIASTISSLNNSHLSLVLLGDQGANASFYSYLANNPAARSNLFTADNGPQIQLDGFVPVPEPSSIVLGLMSIGSMLGFRRKKHN